MNIGIDIDDTISNTNEVLFNYAEKYTVEELKREIEEPKQRLLAENSYCEKFHKWTSDESEEFWKKYYEKIIKEVNAKKYAKEVMKRIRNQGHKVYLVTARFERKEFDVKQTTKEWLEKNEIEYDYIIFNAKDKLKAVEENQIKLLIDDAIPNCEKVSNAGIQTYIMDSINNRAYDIPNVKRLYSWIHLEQEVNKFLKIK